MTTPSDSNARRIFIARFGRLIGALGFARVLAPSLADGKQAPRQPESSPIDGFAAVLAGELGSQNLIESDRITLETPLIAEDGAIVPISIEADLSDVHELVVLVEKNPRPLAARFKLSGTIDPFVSLRIKMNETCDVIALAKTARGIYGVRKNVKVLVGGCG